MNYKIRTNGVEYEVQIHKVEGNIAHLTVNEVDFEVEIEGLMANPTRMSSNPAEKTTKPGTIAKPKTHKTSYELKSPLPGTILDLYVNKGDTINKGQVLLILEAMKMENSIEAEYDGVVENIYIKKGDSVLEGDLLLIIK